MAAAFDRAGFTAVDVHMSDLLAGRAHLADFTGLAACGGFSYGDVLGAGSGWAQDHPLQRAAEGDVRGVLCSRRHVLARRLQRLPDDGAVEETSFPAQQRGRCSSATSRRALKRGSAWWRLRTTPSLFFDGMAGARVPIVVAHGEGHVSASADRTAVALRYIDTYGRVTEHYPLNPSGSAAGVAGLSSDDGRALIMMPHPERMSLGVQHTWTRELRTQPVAAHVRQRPQVGGMKRKI